ncbi:MAG: multiheme c-type cytochrome, partial [Desulfobacterales bacterium]
MNTKAFGQVLIPALVVIFIAACGVEQPVDVKAITSQPKTYVGSDTCKMCHLEHYDSWKMTLHSRMLQDAKKNEDAIIVPIDEKVIRE